MQLRTLQLFIIIAGLGLGLSANLAAQSTAAPDSYRLRAGDKVSVKFAYHSELNETSLILRPDGCIGLQLIDDVPAAGLTTAELRRVLENKYAEVLLQPVISVSVVEFLPPRVFVGGQVQRPGRYDLRDAQTLLQALLTAGGFTNDANKKLVLHARPVAERELVITEVDVAKLLSRQGAGTEITLRDGDYIFVPDTKLAKFTRVLSAFQGLVPGVSLLR